MELGLMYRKESDRLFIWSCKPNEKDLEELKEEGIIVVDIVELTKHSLPAMEIINCLKKHGMDDESFYSLMSDFANAVYLNSDLIEKRVKQQS